MDYICGWAKQRLDAQPQQDEAGPAPSLTPSSEEEDDDVFDVEELKRKLQKAQKPRGSVSAEVYGTHNVKQPYIPQVIQKSAEQKAQILERLGESFMFKMLDERDKQIVIDAMQERRYKQGEYVIKEGENGAELFLVDQGTLNCYKALGGADTDTYLLTYRRGMAFGE